MIQPNASLSSYLIRFGVRFLPMAELTARYVCAVPSADGPQADILLIEPNGDEHLVRCLCRINGTTEIGGDGESLAYLNERYGSQIVCRVARQSTLSR